MLTATPRLQFAFRCLRQRANYFSNVTNNITYQRTLSNYAFRYSNNCRPLARQLGEIGMVA